MQVIVPERAAPGSLRVPVSVVAGSVIAPVSIAAMQFGWASSCGAPESALSEALATPAPVTNRIPTAATAAMVRLHLVIKALDLVGERLS